MRVPRWDSTGALSRRPTALPVHRQVPIGWGIASAIIESGASVKASSRNAEGLGTSAEKLIATRRPGGQRARAWPSTSIGRTSRSGSPSPTTAAVGQPLGSARNSASRWRDVRGSRVALPPVSRSVPSPTDRTVRRRRSVGRWSPPVAGPRAERSRPTELPNGHGAESVRGAMTERILRLPAKLRKSTTRDQGQEMARHVQFTVDTGVQLSFCDPKSPWQRGSNENTNGLLRQYLPKSADLSWCTRRELDAITRSLDTRPRRTLGRMTPSKAFAEAVAMIARGHRRVGSHSAARGAPAGDRGGGAIEVAGTLRTARKSRQPGRAACCDLSRGACRRRASGATSTRTTRRWCPWLLLRCQMAEALSLRGRAPRPTSR